jgi:hypothetical protein
MTEQYGENWRIRLEYPLLVQHHPNSKPFSNSRRIVFLMWAYVVTWRVQGLRGIMSDNNS